jgi:hypothetical protein
MPHDAFEMRIREGYRLKPRHASTFQQSQPRRASASLAKQPAELQFTHSPNSHYLHPHATLDATRPAECARLSRDRIRSFDRDALTGLLAVYRYCYVDDEDAILLNLTFFLYISQKTGLRQALMGFRLLTKCR